MLATAIETDKGLLDAPTIYTIRVVPEFANQSTRIEFSDRDESKRDAEYSRLEKAMPQGETSLATTGWYYSCETVQPTQRITTLWATGARPEEQNGVVHFVGRDGKPLSSTCRTSDEPARGVFVPNCPVETKLTREDLAWVRAYWASL